jgi:predicted nucleic acid-binding protein
MSVFADTSGLYALLVRSEEHHDETVQAFRELVEGEIKIFTTSYVLVETVALLQHRIGLDPVRDLEDQIAPFLTIEWVPRDLHAKGLERLFREDRRQLSLVDCVSLEYMRAAGLAEALALDPHFEEAGFSLLPPRTKRASRGRPSRP